MTALGVRHHGPGSARSVLLALEELQPDSLLVEGVPELDPVLPLLAEESMVPPVAGLVHDVDEPSRAFFYPLASFSPEWVALRWALGRGVPVRMADLAATHAFALERERTAEKRERAAAEGEERADEEPGDRGSARTPRWWRPDLLAELATAAGYDDPERWWEDAVEHRADSSLDRFALVAEAVTAVREGADPAATRPEESAPRWLLENARREAAMRQAVRAEWRAGRRRVAFVCGAYHAPAVDPTGRPAAADSRLLVRLPRAKVAATWVPWSTGRLTRASGYGAGVWSPGWYQHLFEHWQHTDARSGSETPAAGAGHGTVVADSASASWLVRTARALREQDLSAAPASVVEAVRLADALAVLRGRPSVGLEELLDATRTVLTDGSEVPLRLVVEQLVVGDELGQVPPSTPMAPVAADLARAQRSLRLRVSTEPKVLELDLRQDSGRARSVLFHRLGVLGVRWATPVEAGASTGTFKEAWQLRWQPELTVALVESGLYGNTVAQAAAGKLRERARTAEDLTQLAGLVEQCLLAELDDALATVVSALDEQAAQQQDVLTLLGSVEPMARTRRYGDVRGVDTAQVGRVLLTVVRRASVGLRAACSALDDDAAARARQVVESAEAGLILLDDADMLTTWRQALTAVADDEGLHGAVVGRANRMLLDAGALPTEVVQTRLSRWLSLGADPTRAAGFLDGLLAGDALLLVHEPTLLELVDAWVAGVGAETFEALLPLLRRTFAGFAPAERRTIGQVLHRDAEPARAAAGYDPVRADPAVQALARLLGLTGEDA
ncbi:hypothetical protein GC722_01035 [Auraticoccus sp. F435]|uniref:Uncharacterized protein n=1 Tax=Auraticoccus cholistanensis TaxID=2656650 RepID=A0A6A9UTV1_9ACTN|nr:hypothetical protein [Auraticoccus cholistanensis]